MGECRDAAFASCWGSAAMETKQIWTWVCSCSIIYCVVLFLSLVEGREYLFFLATHWILRFCLLFFSVSFFKKKKNFSTVIMSLAVLVLEMFLDVLYFHSCGIVGIMMVKIKLAHLCCLWIVCWMWALGFVWQSEEKTQYMNSSWGPVLCENAVVSAHWTPRMLCAKKKKKKKPNLTTLHATGL